MAKLVLGWRDVVGALPRTQGPGRALCVGEDLLVWVFLWFILYLAAQRIFRGAQQSPHNLGRWKGSF